MIKLYKTEQKIISEIDNYEPDAWIQLTKPTVEESRFIAEKFDIDLADVRAALDDEESSRVEVEKNYTLILVDIPSIEIRNDREAYTTIPLGIILLDQYIITVCAEETPVLEAFLIDLHELESNLVYFATSLRANGVVLDKLTRYSSIKQYPEDRELLDDVVVENKQAIEMTTIYRDIINGTRELMTTIINNRLNNVMKFLAAITIVMAIPTIISGIYGMNVSAKWMPLANTPYGFEIVCGIILLVSILIALILKKKKMLKM